MYTAAAEKSLFIVTNEEQFKAALVSGFAHIEIQSHLNLTAVFNGESVRSRISVPQSVRTIRGRCQGIPIPSSWAPSFEAPMAPDDVTSQCLLFFGRTLSPQLSHNIHFPISELETPVWLDNIYIRLSEQSLNALHIIRQAYITDTIIQGTGSTRDEIAVYANRRILMQDCLVTDFTSASSTVIVEKEASFVDTDFANCHVSNDEFANRGIISHWTTSSEGTTLQSTSFTNVTVNGGAYLQVAQTGSKGTFFTDSEMNITVGESGGNLTKSSALSDAPSGFLAGDDDWIQHMRAVLDNEGLAKQESGDDTDDGLLDSLTNDDGSLWKILLAGIGAGVATTLIIVACVLRICLRKRKSMESAGADRDIEIMSKDPVSKTDVLTKELREELDQNRAALQLTPRHSQDGTEIQHGTPGPVTLTNPHTPYTQTPHSEIPPCVPDQLAILPNGIFQAEGSVSPTPPHPAVGTAQTAEPTDAPVEDIYISLPLDDAEDIQDLNLQSHRDTYQCDHEQSQPGPGGSLVPMLQLQSNQEADNRIDAQLELAAPGAAAPVEGSTMEDSGMDFNFRGLPQILPANPTSIAAHASGPTTPQKHPQECPGDLEAQLEMQLEASVGSTLLQDFKVLDGPSNRMHGGNAIIQVVEDVQTHDLNVAKFFTSDTAYLKEKSLYMDPNQPLGKLIPGNLMCVDSPEDAGIRDANGKHLPSCIIMEKGKTLETALESTAPLDKFTGLQVLTHIASRLSDLHTHWYVHCSVSPGHVLWLPKKRQWTIIDFSTAVRTSSLTATSFANAYTAPESITARRHGDTSIPATEALDSWAVGVLALQIFSGFSVFAPELQQDQIEAMIIGDQKAPWEDPETSDALLSPLGALQGTVLRLLARDPAYRLSMTELLQSCQTVVASTTAIMG